MKQGSAALRPALTLAAAFCAAHLLFRASDTVYVVTASHADLPGRFLLSELPLTVLLLLTALSPYTRFCRPMLAAGCVWRGASLGCAWAAVPAGRLCGVSPARVLVFTTASTFFYLLAVAESASVHPALLDADAGDLSRAHLKRSLVLAGACFLCDLALIY